MQVTGDRWPSPPRLPQPRRPSLAELFVPEGRWIDTSDRDAVVAAHAAEYQAAPPSLDWSGDLGTCAAGDSTPDYRQATLRRVNYYRAMAGVPAVITEDPDLSAKAQRAALMMSAEGTLTHEPSPDFACFTRVGREAAGTAICTWVVRARWPSTATSRTRASTMWTWVIATRSCIPRPVRWGWETLRLGRRSCRNALWCVDEYVFDETSPSARPPLREDERFVAWPPRGYVPPDIVYPRWSVTMADADFSEAEVTMYDLSESGGGRPVPLTVVNRSGSVGHVPLPTIVWEPTIEPSQARDTSYYVVVSGIRSLHEPAVPGSAEATAPDVLAHTEPAVPSGLAYTVTVLGRGAW